MAADDASGVGSGASGASEGAAGVRAAGAVDVAGFFAMLGLSERFASEGFAAAGADVGARVPDAASLASAAIDVGAVGADDVGRVGGSRDGNETSGASSASSSAVADSSGARRADGSRGRGADTGIAAAAREVSDVGNGARESGADAPCVRAMGAELSASFSNSSSDGSGSSGAKSPSDIGNGASDAGRELLGGDGAGDDDADADASDVELTPLLGDEGAAPVPNINGAISASGPSNGRSGSSLRSSSGSKPCVGAGSPDSAPTAPPSATGPRFPESGPSGRSDSFRGSKGTRDAASIIRLSNDPPPFGTAVNRRIVQRPPTAPWAAPHRTGGRKGRQSVMHFSLWGRHSAQPDPTRHPFQCRNGPACRRHYERFRNQHARSNSLASNRGSRRVCGPARQRHRACGG